MNAAITHRGTRRSEFAALCLSMFLVGAWFAERPSHVVGQVRARQPVARAQSSQAKPRVEDAASFRTERQVLQRLKTAEELLAERRFGEAVRYLGSILEADEDYFFQRDDSASVYRSLKSEAHRLIGRMPREGRASYDLQYGARARNLLDEAVRSGEIEVVAEVARRFFHTEAGYEATYLLGTHYLLQDRPLAAALCLERLVNESKLVSRFEPALSVLLATCWLRAEMHDKAEQVLRAATARWPNRKVTIGGHEKPLLESGENPLAWLAGAVGPQSPNAPSVAEDWLMHRGVPSRNPTTDAGSPLLERHWRVPAANNPQLEDVIARRHAMHLQQRAMLIPSLQPLVVDDVVLMRTTRNLLAVDFRTGKRLWEVPINETLEPRLRSSTAPTSPSFVTALDQRIWDDLAYGTMSSDGRHVFSIEDLPLNPVTASDRVVFRANGARQSPSTVLGTNNRLAAHHIRTGKLVWELGGPKGDYPLRLAGTTFLGPPLPLGERLYTLTDTSGEIRLLSLDPGTGEVDWSQQLAVVEWGISQDPVRRLSGVSPSFADGVLVCPTSAGAVVAVDLTTRSLLWGFRYGRSKTSYGKRLAGGFRGQVAVRRGTVRQTSSSRPTSARWLEASAVISGGRVVLTPIESDQIYCIDLLEGTEKWKKPRNDSLYVAGVVDGNVYLVGQSSIRGLRLEDGEPARSKEQFPLPAQSRPSGRGYLSDHLYYLPLTTAEVATIDLRQGKIIALSKSRKGHIPGNLVCYRGSIVSQNVDGVERFHQLSALESDVSGRLAVNPDDAQALALRGEIALHEGRINNALLDLGRSHDLRPDPHTKELLVDALLAALEDDFEGYRNAAARLDQLMDRPQQRATYLRLLARGLEESGEYLEAFRTYLRLLQPELGEPKIERVEPALSVRRDRWFQANLAILRRRAPDADRDEMDREVAVRFDAAHEADDTAKMRELLQYFAGHPAADDGELWLAERMLAKRELLEAEFRFERLRSATDSRHRHAAVAHMAKLLLDSDRAADAAEYYRLLRGPLAETICLEGKTGQELYDELDPDSELRRILEDHERWPKGNVEVASRTDVVQPQRFFPCALRGDLGPFFQHSMIELDRARLALVGRDGLGQQVWRQSLIETGRTSPAMMPPITPDVVHGRVAGHLAVISTGRQLYAIDTLGAGVNQSSRLLWRANTSEPVPGIPTTRATVHASNVAQPWGGQKMSLLDANGQPVGRLGPVTLRFTCFQKDRDLVAVDTLSGETLWIRHQIEPGSDLFGDDDRVFVLPRDGDEAIVLRSLDGKLLGTRKLPPAEQWITTLGARILTFEQAEIRQDDAKEETTISKIALVDPWEDETIWQREYRGKVKAWAADSSSLAVVEPAGKFELVNLSDGEPRIQSSVDPAPSLNSVYAITSPDSYILIVNRRLTNSRVRVSVSPVPGGANNKTIHGHVYGFDRSSGEKLWSLEVENQALVLDQPKRLPVLVFASRVYERSPANNQRRTPRYPVLCVDKRTGQILHQEQLKTHITAFQLHGDPQRQQVELRLPRETIHMVFRQDEAPPPDSRDNAPDSAALRKTETTRAAGQADLRKASSDHGTAAIRPLTRDSRPVQIRSRIAAEIERGGIKDIHRRADGNGKHDRIR